MEARGGNGRPNPAPPLPATARVAYNPVQTVINGLSDRGLLARRREGHVIVYVPALSEAKYLSRSIEHTMRGALVSSRWRSSSAAPRTSAVSRTDALGDRSFRRGTRAPRRGRRSLDCWDPALGPRGGRGDPIARGTLYRRRRSFGSLRAAGEAGDVRATVAQMR